MIAELGHFSLILALGLAICLTVIPALGVYHSRVIWMRLSHSLSMGLFVFVLLSFACLTNAFLADDFSVAYVARNSNTALPIQYKISAVWGAHEGSFLLWILIMAGWTLAVSLFSGGLTVDMRARVLSVMGALSIGFLLFLLLTSNPFDRSLPVFPKEGSDLNPLLQDFGLIVHPPMLYMGYVGFAVPFAFAIATLSSGRLDSAWARWSRPWTNAAWACLTIGITLGSWWAYYELGWGGWWFWDAVENASFMPWLVGTALIHSLAGSEKRGVFKSWTVLLAIFAFSFSLLGAFLVRSGVLTSVHAFAVDPERGIFILVFLVLVIGSSLILYAIKASNIRSEAGFDLTSRETLLLVNNLLLAVAAMAVLLGTIYPLIYETMTGGGKISVGPPYFNTVFVPIVLLLFIPMAISPRSRWKKTSLDRLLLAQVWPLLSALLIVNGLILALAPAYNVVVAAIASIALWILINLALDWKNKVVNKSTRSRGFTLAALFSPGWSYFGMLLGHAGIAVALLGVLITVYFSEEKDVRMGPGDVVTLSGYDFKLNKIAKVQGPNYIADEAEIEITLEGEYIVSLYPQKRFYSAGGSLMTEADMDVGLFRDLYVALGEPINDSDWAVRVHYKPFVRWIWWGGMLIALGGLITILDRRYRTRRAPATVRANSTASAEGIPYGQG
ncbi:MAG: heme lyase CcmF/NrfE family subunit [Pseudomonadales bacterium]|nr:heme lyase CcmF/NrfE family subunit [Pseudomonadales bacterium]